LIEGTDLTRTAVLVVQIGLQSVHGVIVIHLVLSWTAHALVYVEAAIKVDG